MKNFMVYDFNITKIDLACFIAANQGKHSHTNRRSHGLALHLAGEKDYHFSTGEVLHISGSALIYLPRGSTYYVKTAVPGDCYAINFQISDDNIFLPFVQSAKKRADLIDFFKSATAHWDNKNTGYNMRCKAELYNIICIMQDEYNKRYIPKNTYRLIAPAVEYINANFALEPLNISRLAAMCGITPEYFRKLFKEIFGYSPVAYINKKKIEKAEELINSGMYSVSDAAELSGYSDISHFSREFKKATGKCPSKYLK